MIDSGARSRLTTTITLATAVTEHDRCADHRQAAKKDWEPIDYLVHAGVCHGMAKIWGTLPT